MANPYAKNQYLKTQVETASKEQLVVMLFDGIVRFTEQARKSMERNEIENIHQQLMRAQAIVMELIYTVDREKGGEVARNLLALHAYAFNCLIQANLKRDTAKIDEVQEIYRKLRDAWSSAMGSLGISSTKDLASPVASAAETASAPPPPAPPLDDRQAEIHPKIARLPAAPSGAPRISDTSASIAKPAAAYGMGKTAAPSAGAPRAAGQLGAIQAQHARSAAMRSAYQNGSRNIA
ncbi:MAG: flagellar export chaperone FliS [Planctomycetota bacterium]|nr:flagellar export chaperone FliS [Planctomycetota bacterium]